ncbi:MAG: cation/multidrug efflux pump, partial [Phycisphaerales bacterium]|nr:cation/multidrug efflux pump [Phycisphaerales bacterium]
MNLSEPFIRRPVMTMLLTVTVILFGVVAYKKLPVSDLPTVDYPVIQVQVAYPGASPQTMAANVATPLERQFMQIPGIDVITSNSSQGNAKFVLQFTLSKSIDAAATDVQAAISQAQGSLPTDLPAPPTFTKTNPNDQPIMYIALTSDSVTRGAVYDFANTQVGQRISIVEGVSRVQVYGTKSAVRIKADPSKMAIRKISLDDLMSAVQANTSYVGAGQIDGPEKTVLLNPRGQLETAEQYNNLIVNNPARDGAPVYLKDVAQAVESVQDERINMRFWARGHETPSATVVVAVFRQAGANAVDVSKSVRALLPVINAELPPSIRITPIYDRSISIVHSVTDVQATLYIAFVLVVLVIFAFLGRARDTLIPAVALPLSLLITFLVMWVLDYSLDNLSLMALTLAIGFLVDDAIVFLENTVRRMEEGESAYEATFHSAREISFTILAMTISLAAVFLPLVLMQGLIGRIFREFSVTIIVSIFASGIVSLTLTPMMCSRFLAKRGAGAKKTAVERFSLAVEHRVLAVYGRSLTWFLRRRWISAIMWVLCLVGTYYLFNAIPKTFLPIGDSGFIFGVLIGDTSASPERMRTYQDQADVILKANPAVATTFTMTGMGQFLPSNMGLALAFLEDRDQRKGIDDVNKELGGKLFSIPGVVPSLRPQPALQISTGAAATSQGQFSYSISGVNPVEVYATGAKLLQKFNGFPGFAPPITSDYYMFFDRMPNLDIEILRDEAKTYGVSVSKIESLLRSGFSQNYAYLIKKPTDQYQVILELADRDRRDPHDLSKLYVRSDDGLRLVPLDAMVKWHESVGPQSVNHLNQFTSVTYFFNLKPGVPLGDATDYIQKSAAETLPITVRGDMQGEALEFDKTVKSLRILILVAIFVMYVVLGILYESYLHPLTVLSSLPVALVGGLATLWLFHAQASLYAYIGMFMLMGIVKKNGIMIVDFALQRIGHGQSAEQAIHDASMDRFRPIVMTTLAALMGALPIAFGYGADGESRRPLGLVIVGGLIVSQFIT